jgi:predicted O-methyltransferase YrrM
MFFKIKSYFHFLIKSTNKHGIHSPFVYDLVTKCFNKKTTVNKHQLLNRIRDYLYKNNDTIEVNDFGNGSKVFKSNIRKISKIAKIAGISKKRASLLLRVVEYFNPTTILELGSSLGLGTSSLSIGNPNAKIISLEGCKNTSKIAQKTFSQFKLSNIQLITGEFNKTLPQVLLENKFDLIYFDGNHQKEATLHYFNLCLNSAHNKSVFIFDDINWSKEMQEAWIEIKNHPKVTVTINTYFWGFVFFRTTQAKQHFTIRV